jgi:hypothetical protein
MDAEWCVSKANVVALSQKFKVGEGFTIAVSFPKGYVNHPLSYRIIKWKNSSLEKISDRRFSCSDLFPFYFVSWKNTEMMLVFK